MKQSKRKSIKFYKR